MSVHVFPLGKLSMDAIRKATAGVRFMVHPMDADAVNLGASLATLAHWVAWVAAFDPEWLPVRIKRTDLANFIVHDGTRVEPNRWGGDL